MWYILSTVKEICLEEREEIRMGLFYDSSFDCWIQCVSIRETLPEQIKIGTVYHCKTKFFDGEDLYTHVYLPYGDKEIEIGMLNLKHFSEFID